MTSKQKKELDKLFSEVVRMRDNYTCQKCGTRNKHVQCAHIFSRSNLSVRYEPLNALTLCYYCHLNWCHRQPVEWTEWIQNYLGKDKWDTLVVYRNSKRKIDYKQKRSELKKIIEGFKTYNKIKQEFEDELGFLINDNNKKKGDLND